MNKMQNWLVDLNSRVINTEVLDNIITLANQLKPKNISFLYQAKKVELPSELKSEFPDLQDIELKGIAERTSYFLTASLCEEISIDVSSKVGSGLQNLLHKAVEINSDLILTTKSGAQLNKLVKQTDCHVLVVPNKKINIKKALLPIDFSGKTELSLKLVNQLNDRLGLTQVEGVHLYKDASHYFNVVCESPFEVNELMVKRNELNSKLETYVDHKVENFVISNRHLPEFKLRKCRVMKGDIGWKTLNNYLLKSNHHLMIIEQQWWKDNEKDMLGKITGLYDIMNNDSYYLIAKKENAIDKRRNIIESILSFA